MKKILSILGGIICTFICIILFAVETGFISFESVKTVIEKRSIEQVVKNIDVKELISENIEVTSDIYGFFDVLGFNAEDTNKILDSNAFKEFISTYIYGNIDNIINDRDVVIEYESLVKLVDDIESETAVTFQNKEQYLKLLQENYPEIQKSINISNYVKKELNASALEMIRVILSSTLTFIFIVLFIIIYFIMCLFRWSIYKPLLWYGITSTITGFLALQMYAGLSMLDLTTINSNELEKYKAVINPIITVIRNRGLLISLITMLIGISMIVAYHFINKKQKENEINEQSEFLEKGPETL